MCTQRGSPKGLSRIIDETTVVACLLRQADFPTRRDVQFVKEQEKQKEQKL